MPDHYFSQSYEESRERFRGLLPAVKGRWPGASLRAIPLEAGEGLTVDVLAAPAASRRTRLLVLTCGLHGLEGYVGAAVLLSFCHTFLGPMDAEGTGLLLVHAVNPWGMKHRRRCNENNVDLNRNFILDWQALDPEGFNPAYGRIDSFLNPPRPLGLAAAVSFYSRVVGQMATKGLGALKEAFLLGQYRYPRGIYYGGRGYEASTKILQDLFFAAVPAYNKVTLLDLHTGYGPRYRMTLTGSPLEKMSSEEMRDTFGYPLAAKATPEEFYRMQGDMLDYMYTRMEEGWRDTDFFAATMEFGTLGDSLPARLKSARAIAEENQVYQYGAAREAPARGVQKRFEEQFLPQEGRWREKALADAGQAFRGILGARGYLDAGKSA